MNFGPGWLRKGDLNSAIASMEAAPKSNQENIYNHLTGSGDQDAIPSKRRSRKAQKGYYSREALIYLFNEAKATEMVPTIFHKADSTKPSPFLPNDADEINLPQCAKPISPEQKRVMLSKPIQNRFRQSQAYEKDKFGNALHGGRDTGRPQNAHQRRFNSNSAQLEDENSNAAQASSRRYFEQESTSGATETGWHDATTRVSEDTRFESGKTFGRPGFSRPGFGTASKGENWDPAEGKSVTKDVNYRSANASPSAYSESKPYPGIVPHSAQMSASEKFQAQLRDREHNPALGSTDTAASLHPSYGGAHVAASSQQSSTPPSSYNRVNIVNQAQAKVAEPFLRQQQQQSQPGAEFMSPFLQAMLQQQQQQQQQQHQQQLAAFAAALQNRAAGNPANEDVQSKLIDLMQQMSTSSAAHQQAPLLDWPQAVPSVPEPSTSEPLHGNFSSEIQSGGVNFPSFMNSQQAYQHEQQQVGALFTHKQPLMHSSNSPKRQDETFSAQPENASVQKGVKRELRDVNGGLRLNQLSVRWLYVDTNGNIQGPFTPQNMHEWYLAGYFHPELLVKHEDAEQFMYLTHLEAHYGRERPFLLDAENARLAIQTHQAASSGSGIPSMPTAVRELYVSTDSPLQLAFSRGLGSASTAGIPTPFPAPVDSKPVELASATPLEKEVPSAASSTENVSPAKDRSRKKSVPNAANGVNVAAVATPTPAPSGKKKGSKKKDAAPSDLTKRVNVAEKQEKTEKLVEKDAKSGLNPWNIKKEEIKKVSLTDVQAREEEESRQREQRQKEAQLSTIATSSTQQKSGSHAPLSPWGSTFSAGAASPAVSRNKSLADIMKEEEEALKRQQQAKQSAQKSLSNESLSSTGNSSSSALRGYAGIVATGGGATPHMGRPTSAASPSTKAAPSVWGGQSLTGMTAASSAPKSSTSDSKPQPGGSSWTVVGSSAKEKAPSAGAKPAVPGLPEPNPHKVAFNQWCRNTLRSSEKLGVKIDEFLNILMTIPLGDMDIIMQICDDTLGGLTSIDPRKFAREFVNRQQEMQRAMQGTSAQKSTKSRKSVDAMAAFDTGNKFTLVNGGNRKKT